jgi:MOSC domain-containing protein YiiM
MILAIFICPVRREPMHSVDAVRAVPGRGLEGDRYFHGTGSYSRWPGAGREVTLIASESITRLQSEHGFDLSQGAHRRSLVTVGIDLEALVGHEFSVGSVRMRGDRPCAPCRYLNSVVAPGLYEAMKTCGGGLRAEVLTDGIIRLGDTITLHEGPRRGQLPP